MTKINDDDPPPILMETAVVQAKAEFQFIAWRDFLIYCIGEPEVLLRYERETGRNVFQNLFWEVLQSKGCVFSSPVLKQFIKWVTITYWGEDPAPVEYHQRIKSSE